MDLIQILDIPSWCIGPEISNIQDLVSTIITAIQIAIPILLIIFGMIDLGKAVVASKEDEIKKGQQTFIKRLIAAAIVFLVIFIVKVLLNVVKPGDDTIWACVNKFINGSGTTEITENSGDE